jgi:hypothetical protein
MKTFLKLSVLAVLLVVAASPCLALMGLAPVSKERARELGMEVRILGNGPNEVWVELEFKPAGQLKEFDHVSLEISDHGKTLVGYTPLKDTRSASGNVVVRFMAGRDHLEKIALWVVTGPPGNMSAYTLSVKDFVEPVKSK